LKVEQHKSRPGIPQLIRYLLVGGFNTAFGYGLFALLNWGLSRTMPYGYLAATLLSNLIAITVAFLGYKWFVFRTKGNYVREWLRCIGVYSTSMVIGFVGMATLVPIAHRHMQHPQEASYVVGAALTLAMVFVSFLGHKNISFRQVPGAEIPAKV
jgi:putative flippase GtrA